MTEVGKDYKGSKRIEKDFNLFRKIKKEIKGPQWIIDDSQAF